MKIGWLNNAISAIYFSSFYMCLRKEKEETMCLSSRLYMHNNAEGYFAIYASKWNSYTNLPYFMFLFQSIYYLYQGKCIRTFISAYLQSSLQLLYMPNNNNLSKNQLFNMDCIIHYSYCALYISFTLYFISSISLVIIPFTNMISRGRG